MPANPYRGARKPEQRGRWNQPKQQGIMSDDRQAWVTLVDFDAILFIGQDLEGTGFSPDTPPVRIELRIPGRRYSPRISLTKMTLPELEEFEKFMQHAINKARPVCALLDERAKEAFDDGNDGHARLYRPIPEFFDRERFVEQHREGVQKRSGRLVDGVGEEAANDVRRSEVRETGGDPSGLHEAGVGVSSSSLPDEGEEDLVPEHNEPEASSASEVRKVGGLGGFPGIIQAPETGEGSASPDS